MVTCAACADVYHILHLRACGSCRNLTVFYGITCCLQIAKRCFQSCRISVFCGHAVRVDRIAFHVYGVSQLITVVRNLRRCPGCIGDRVVDHGCRIAVVGIDTLITVSGDHGRDRFTQVTGLLGRTVLANLHVVCRKTYITITAVVDQTGSDHIAVQIRIAAVKISNLVCHVCGIAGICDIHCTCRDTCYLICLCRLHEIQVRNLRRALEVIRVRVHIYNTVGVILEDVRACA